MQEFISEDDLQTFEGWMRYQAVDMSTTTAADLATWRRHFEEKRQRCAMIPKVGLMKLQPVPGEYLYAVAVQEDADLWLTLWVRCSRKGELFIMLPRGGREWDAHTSYHLDGTMHTKYYDYILFTKRCQPLTGTFRGCQALGHYAGHGPKGVGAICDPTAFSGVVKLAPNVLGPRHGAVTVDLVEPGQEPTEFPGRIVTREVFRDITPWVVITVGRSD